MNFDGHQAFAAIACPDSVAGSLIAVMADSLVETLTTAA